MPEIQRDTLEGNALQAFRSKITRTKQFLSYAFDLDDRERANFVANLHVVECLDTFMGSTLSPKDFVQVRIENFVKGLTSNMQEAFGVKLKVAVVVTEE